MSQYQRHHFSRTVTNRLFSIVDTLQKHKRQDSGFCRRNKLLRPKTQTRFISGDKTLNLWMFHLTETDLCYYIQSPAQYNSRKISIVGN